MTTHDILGVKADGRSALCQILNQWTRTTIQVAQTWDGIDVPWWYNERASLSTLAGAVWRAGGIAFEEFSAEKLVHTARGKHRMNYSGRCDMFFEFGSREFNIEAKFGYSGGTNIGGDPRPRITGILDEARKAAGRLPVAKEQTRLAVAFITPYFTHKFRNHEGLMICRWIEKTQAIRCSAKAWVFPKISRRLKSEDGYYCPGAAVFVQEVKRAI